jgi:hypothetical protein
MIASGVKVLVAVPIMTLVNTAAATSAKKSPWHYCDVLLRKNSLAKFHIVDGCWQPMIKPASGLMKIVMGRKYVCYRTEFFFIQRSIVTHVCFILPRERAGVLLMHAQCASVVSTVGQETFNDVGITGHKAAA